jgi:hypothetical protein
VTSTTLAKLRARGLRLRNPAEGSLIERAERELAGFSDELMCLYLMFDGFEDRDTDSSNQLSIWRLSQVLDRRNLSDSIDGGRVVFGEFLIESDFIAFTPMIGVRFFEDGRLLAGSIDEFLASWVSGQFDF